MENPEEIIPVLAEELVTGKRTVKTGSVRVHKTVEHLRKVVGMPAVRDSVSVKRIPLDREVETMPVTREEGDTIIVPVVEERLIVRKVLVLKEEIHITRKRTKVRISREVTVDREHATVERLDADGKRSG